MLFVVFVFLSIYSFFLRPFLWHPFFTHTQPFFELKPNNNPPSLSPPAHVILYIHIADRRYNLYCLIIHPRHRMIDHVC